MDLVIVVVAASRAGISSGIPQRVMAVLMTMVLALLSEGMSIWMIL